MPDGNPGHSCVMSEETGLPLANGPICGYYEPPPNVMCNLPAASEADEIVLFGSYEGDAISTVTTVKTAAVSAPPPPPPQPLSTERSQ